MVIKNGYIRWWLGSMIMLLCQACGGSDHEGDPLGEESGPQLEIRVYTPESPTVTRGDIGETVADSEERAIDNLSIWVFEHENGKLVGYLNPSEMPTTESKVYRITVSEAFAKERPNVDVYVMANVSTANSGISLDRNSSREDLENAMIENKDGGDYFGLTTPVTSVPAGGLPMSGVLKDQVVDGLAPIVRVSTNVKVVRAVSKVWFVFSNTAQTEDQALVITSITINSDMIPDKEFLFLNGPYNERDLKVSGGYNEVAKTLIDDPVPVKSYVGAAEYVYVNQTGQQYEADIKSGIESEHLSDAGKFYLRESDKKVTGTVNYTLGGIAKKPATFQMNEPGDFSRNHTWIVYGYFAGKDNLKIFSVMVEDWTETDPATHEVYNW